MSKKSTISQWFQEYGNDVYRFLVYYTGSMDVEDLVQEVFIKALKYLHTYKHNSSPKTWLFTIARNLAIDEMKKRNKNRQRNTNTSYENRMDENEQPEMMVESRERAEEVRSAIQQLQENYRNVVILRGINQLSVAETASILDWSEEKVRTNYHRGLKAMKKQWRDEW